MQYFSTLAIVLFAKSAFAVEQVVLNNAGNAGPSTPPRTAPRTVPGRPVRGRGTARSASELADRFEDPDTFPNIGNMNIRDQAAQR